MTPPSLARALAPAVALTLVSLAAGQGFGGESPPVSLKVLAEGDAGTATTFDRYGKAITGRFSQSGKTDVATLMLNPLGLGQVSNMMGVGNYDGAFKATDPDVLQPTVRDLATLPLAAPGNLDLMALVTTSGIDLSFYCYAGLEYEYVSLLGAPYGDARWITCGMFGGGAACDIAFTRPGPGNSTQLVILEDVSVVGQNGAGPFTGYYEKLRTIALMGEAHGLCSLNYVVDLPSDLDELAVITSYGTKVISATGSVVGSYGPTQAGDLMTPRLIGSTPQGRPIHSLVTVGQLGTAFFVQEHVPGFSTTPASLGQLQILAIATGDVDIDGEPDLLGKSALAEIPFVLLYDETAPEKPMSLATGDWFGGLPPGDPDPDNATLAVADYENDGDWDLLTGNFENDAWLLMRSEEEAHLDNLPTYFVDPEDPGGGGPSPGVCDGIGSYTFTWPDDDGGALTLTLGQPIAWPRNIPRSTTDAALVVRVWSIDDPAGDADQQSRHREVFGLSSVDPGAALATIVLDTRGWHDLDDTSSNAVLSLEICLGELDEGAVIEEGPAGFKMFVASGFARDALKSTYNLTDDDFDEACFTITNGSLPGNDFNAYGSNGCQQYGKPPADPPF